MRTWPEHEYVEKHLPTKGHQWVAQRIKREPSTVWSYANRHGIRFGDVPGWTRTSDLARAAGRDNATVWNRAKREGVLRRVGAATGAIRARMCIVPNEWADAYLAECNTRTEGDDRRGDGWLTVNELVALWSVGRGTVIRALNGHGVLAPLLAGARTARGHTHSTTGLWLVHPGDAAAVRARLEADRRKAKVMVSTKSLSVECGVKQSYAAGIGREMGGELLFVRGRIMCHVTRAVADVMRERFETGVTPGKRLGRPQLRRAA